MTPRSPAAQSDMGDPSSLALMIGEMRGQMRELIHNINNMSQKVNDLWDRVAATQNLSGDVQALKGDVVELRARMTVLEAQENKRVGALGLSSWMLRIIPVLGLLGAGAGIMKLIGA